MKRQWIFMRVLSLMLLVSAGLFVLAGQARPAAAAAPVITEGTIVQDTPGDFGTTCDNFEVLATFTVNYRKITFYDDANDPLRQIRHVNFTGTLYNSVTNASIPYDGSFDRTQDYVQNTVTFTGRHFRVHIPGQGTLALDVGRTILDFSEDPPGIIFEAGQHDFDAQICALLN